MNSLAYCPECGDEVEEGVNYCESCGQRLDTHPQDSQDPLPSEDKESPSSPPTSPEKQNLESKGEENDEVSTKDAAMGFLIIIVVIILVIGGIYLAWGGDDDEKEIRVFVEDVFELELAGRVGLDIDVLVQNPTDEAVEVREEYFKLETDYGNTYAPISQVPEYDGDLPTDKEVEFTLTFEIPSGETASIIRFDPPGRGSYEGYVGDY